VEEKLRDSEAEYRILFNCNPHPMWVFDVKTLRFLAANEAAIRHYGYSRSHSRVSSEREPQFTSFCRSPTSGVSSRAKEKPPEQTRDRKRRARPPAADMQCRLWAGVSLSLMNFIAGEKLNDRC